MARGQQTIKRQYTILHGYYRQSLVFKPTSMNSFQVDYAFIRITTCNIKGKENSDFVRER